MASDDERVENGELFSIEDGAGVAVIRVHGEVDYLNSEQFAAVIASTRGGVGRNVIIDLSECRYIDSSVLSVLVRARKAAGDGLRLVIPLDSHIRRIFSITGLERTMRVHDTVENAAI